MTHPFLLVLLLITGLIAQPKEQTQSATPVKTADTLADTSDSHKGFSISDSSKIPDTSAADTPLVLIDSASMFPATTGSTVDSTEPEDSATRTPETGGESAESLLRTLILRIGGVAVAVAILILIVVYRVRAYRRSRAHAFLTRTRISIMDSEVQLVCRYIEKVYRDPDLTPESICQALTTGVSFVETLFRRELDMSLNEFITQVRIHHAVQEINDGFDGSPERLAVLSGYNDLERFSSDFFHVTGKELTALMNRTV